MNRNLEKPGQRIKPVPAFSGEPKVGRRFKGKVWMQGRVFFDEALG